MAPGRIELGEGHPSAGSAGLQGGGGAAAADFVPRRRDSARPNPGTRDGADRSRRPCLCRCRHRSDAEREGEGARLRVRPGSGRGRNGGGRFLPCGTASAGAHTRARRSWADLPARSGVRCRFRAACLGRRAGSPSVGSAADLVGVHHGRHRPAAVEGPPFMVPRGRGGPHDCSRDPAFHGGANEGARAIAPGRPYAARHRARDRRGYYSRGRG